MNILDFKFKTWNLEVKKFDLKNWKGKYGR